MNTRSVWRPDRDEVVVEHGAVATAHPIAARVGVDILKSGGNAVDAAVATGFCLNVVEPASSSIAGHGQMIIHMTAQNDRNPCRSIAVDYGHRAPRAATADMFRVIGQAVKGNGIYEVDDQANAIGHRSVGVPGVTAGMCRAHQLFGSLPLEQLLEPAAHYAREGFEVDPATCLQIARNMPNLLRYGEAAHTFLPDGYPPSPGEKIVQRDLADTLERIGRDGKDALYRGEIAAAIDEEMKRNGGILSSRDLAEYDAEVLDPVRSSYRGYELIGSPVPAGTITHLQTLNILEMFELRRLAHNSPEHLHLFTEAARHAFADRYSFLGDPDFEPVPLDGILSREYAREVATSIDREAAKLEAERELQPWVAYANNPLHDAWRYDSHPRPEHASPASPPSDGDCTTHFSIIDRDRNMVACTQTAVGAFGSSVVVPSTGGAAQQRDGHLQPHARHGKLDRRFQAWAEQHEPGAAAERRATLPRRRSTRRAPNHLPDRTGHLKRRRLRDEYAGGDHGAERRCRRTRDLRRPPDRSADGRRSSSYGPQRRGCPGAFHRRRIRPATRRHDRPNHRPPPRRRAPIRYRRSQGILETVNHDEQDAGFVGPSDRDDPCPCIQRDHRLATSRSSNSLHPIGRRPARRRLWKPLRHKHRNRFHGGYYGHHSRRFRMADSFWFPGRASTHSQTARCDVIELCGRPTRHSGFLHETQIGIRQGAG